MPRQAEVEGRERVDFPEAHWKPSVTEDTWDCRRGLVALELTGTGCSGAWVLGESREPPWARPSLGSAVKLALTSLSFHGESLSLHARLPGLRG